ncbi:MAG: LAGLIDADG family homing endonuclease, partial [Verrucomicrobiota bacterium]
MGIVPKRRILDAARALKVENSALQKEIRELEARIAYLDELGVWTARPNARIDKREPKSGLREGAAVALLSDVHIGEVVDPSQIDGLNEYNFEVCKRRLSKFFRGVIYLVRNDQKAFNVRDLVLWLGGDIVTGYLRDEDLEACEYSPTESSLLARGLLQEGVQFLLDELDVETIHVLCSHGNHGRCHDKSTELLTKCGWRSYDELNIGDVVATYVLESGETEWQALTDVYVDQYDGPMVHVQTRTADYMVTPRHRMVLGDVKTTTDQFMEMQEIVERGSFGAKSWPKCALGHDRDLLGVSDDELRLLGWIMTDGHYTRGVDISISQSKPEGIAALRALLAALEIEYTIGDRKRLPPVIKGVQVKEVLREYTFYLRRADAARLIELVPDRYVVPDWMRNLSRRQFNAFLDGLLAGDGHVRDRERVLYSPFEFLTQVQQLAVTNGIAARLRKDKRGDYILSLPTSTRGYVNDFKSSVQVVRYKGAIWCGTVPNGTL